MTNSKELVWHIMNQTLLALVTLNVTVVECLHCAGPGSISHGWAASARARVHAAPRAHGPQKVPSVACVVQRGITLNPWQPFFTRSLNFDTTEEKLTVRVYNTGPSKSKNFLLNALGPLGLPGRRHFCYSVLSGRFSELLLLQMLLELALQPCSFSMRIYQ